MKSFLKAFECLPRRIGARANQLRKEVKNMQASKVLIWCSVLLVLCGSFAFGQAKDEKRPTVAIISVPTDLPGEAMASEPIKGTVAGVSPKEHKVVIYARGGNVWYVQPSAASPLTDIGGDGKWESETHGGTDFVALLVKSSYDAKATLSTLPPVAGDILARDTQKPKKKSEK